MIEILEDRDQLIELRFSGTVDGADYERLGPWLEQRLAGPIRPLRMLVHAEDWEGWSGPGAAWADLKLDMRFAGRFERVAIIGDSRWQAWMTRLSDLFVSTELRWFDRSDATAAEASIAGGGN